MFKKILLAAFVTFIHWHAWAQPFDKGKLDNYLQVLEKNDKFMGSVAILQNGAMLYTNATGFADIEKKIKADANTKYRIGSISKTFTTVLVFKAIEENKMTLQESLGKYFPTIKNANQITIAQLLQHRSGIHNFTDSPDYLKWNTEKKSQAEMVAIIEKGGIDFEPDSKAAYSNSNFVLLSYILEKVYKKPFAELLNEKIVKPIGLKNTSAEGKINVENHDANSYEYVEKWVKQPETDLSIPMGAGSVVSTPTDLMKFAEALFEGKLVSARSVDQMKTLKDNFGMGLFQIPFYDKMSFGHTGGIDGFRSVYGYFPNEKVGFAIIGNANNFVTNNISIAVLSSVFGKPYNMPEIINYVPEQADLEKYPGIYSSKEIPLKITVTLSGKTLSAQATGQPTFSMEPTDKGKFKFDQAGLVMEFDPAQKKMVLKQGGGVYNFAKE